MGILCDLLVFVDIEEGEFGCEFIMYDVVDWVILIGVWDIVVLFCFWCFDLLLFVEMSGKNVIVVIFFVDFDFVVVDFVKSVFGYVG